MYQYKLLVSNIWFMWSKESLRSTSKCTKLVQTWDRVNCNSFILGEAVWRSCTVQHSPVLHRTLPAVQHYTVPTAPAVFPHVHLQTPLPAHNGIVLHATKTVSQYDAVFHTFTHTRRRVNGNKTGLTKCTLMTDNLMTTQFECSSFYALFCYCYDYNVCSKGMLNLQL